MEELKMIKVLLAKDLATARRMEEEKIPVVTVECEYGLEVVEGQLHTMAHHVPGWETAPSLQMNIKSFKFDQDDYIMISHLDLDTICGIMAAIGEYNVSEDIKKGVNYVDCNGQQHLFDTEVSEEAREFILSYIGYAQKNRAPFGVEDVTEYVSDAISSLRTREYYEAGKAFVENRKAEAEASVVSTLGSIALIEQKTDSTAFGLNSEYILGGKEYDYVIVFSNKFKSVTISARRGSNDPKNMAELVRVVFGPEADGHHGIAGSPRGKEFSLEDAARLQDVLALSI